MVEDIKRVGVPQSKPIHGFSTNFQDTVEDLELIRLFFANTSFLVLKFVRVPQPKHMHGFSPNFQDIFTSRQSRAD